MFKSNIVLWTSKYSSDCIHYWKLAIELKVGNILSYRESNPYCCSLFNLNYWSKSYLKLRIFWHCIICRANANLFNRCWLLCFPYNHTLLNNVWYIEVVNCLKRRCKISCCNRKGIVDRIQQYLYLSSWIRTIWKCILNL